MKATIIAIVGPSGSGKTTLVEHLKTKINIPVIVSYTTRPIRENEKNGVDHHFVTNADMPPIEQMLAYTQFGGYHYWANINQVPDNGICSYVVDEKGLIELQSRFSHRYHIIPILITRHKDLLQQHISNERLLRDKERIKMNNSDYAVIINNNGTLENFLEKGIQIIKTLIEYDA